MAAGREIIRLLRFTRLHVSANLLVPFGCWRCRRITGSRDLLRPALEPAGIGSGASSAPPHPFQTRLPEQGPAPRQVRRHPSAERRSCAAASKALAGPAEMFAAISQALCRPLGLHQGREAAQAASCKSPAWARGGIRRHRARPRRAASIRRLPAKGARGCRRAPTKSPQSDRR